MSLEAPPPTRSEEEILRHEVYVNIMKDREKARKEAEKKRQQKIKEQQKLLEKEMKKSKEKSQTNFNLLFEEGI